MKDKPTSMPAWRTIMVRHPFWAFVTLAFLWSWFFWGLAIVVSPRTVVGTVAFYAGGFGPLAGAVAMVAIQGRPVGAWLRGLFRWRVHPAWYVFVLGFPAFLVAVTSLVYLAAGGALDFSLLPERLAAFGTVLLTATLIGGGNEEPGWRGFGLPQLQRRLGPISATLTLGVVWALWHLPLLGLGETSANDSGSGLRAALAIAVLLVSVTVHAFWYTWLINRTDSVLLCMILHGSYNAANGLLVLVPKERMHGGDEFLLLTLMTAVLIASVLVLLLATKGRLGRRSTPQPPPATG